MPQNVLKFIAKFYTNQIRPEEELQNWVKSFFQKCHEKNIAYESEVYASKQLKSNNWYEANIFVLEVLVTYFNVKQACDIDYNIAEICKKWCKLDYDVPHWLVPMTNERFYFESKSVDPQLKISQFAFGTQPEIGKFVSHYHYKEKPHKTEIMCAFHHSKRIFSVYFSPYHNRSCAQPRLTFIFSVKYDSISRVVVDYSLEDTSDLLFHLHHPPAVYTSSTIIQSDAATMSTVAEIQYHPEKFERTLYFGCKCYSSYQTIEKIGKSPVLKIDIMDKYRARHVIHRLSQRCNEDVEICYCKVGTKMIPYLPSLKGFMHFPPQHMLSLLSRKEFFNCQYAWKTLFCQTLVLLDHICLLEQNKPNSSKAITKKLEGYISKDVSVLVQTLFEISCDLNKCFVLQFESALDMVFEFIQACPTAIQLPTGVCLVRRVIFTPSRVIYLPPSEHFDNRVIRRFGSEYMLRVSVQDDNFSKLTYSIQYHTQRENFLERIVGEKLRFGINIGCRKYEVLACSNSQLRDHGLWLYAEDAMNNTAANVRSWLGDFSKIHNVAKYMSRMGQCFSTTEQGAQLSVSGKNELKLQDIRNKKYVFTDGIGIISSSLANEVRDVLKKNHRDMRNYKPSAFQIRYKGCKGMVVEYPNCGDRVLAIRPSMIKFKCPSSNQLEIVKTSAPRKLYLNRPLITILEQLGIKSEVFVDLQKNMILSIVQSLIYEVNATKAMEYYLPSYYSYNELQKAGVSLIEEPFFRSLLLSTFKISIDLLRSKGRIRVPPDYGRNMLGVADETGTLKYGQVFVQYSKSTEYTSSELIILKGPVVVTKNPCMHPGDVRKLEAVDVPALRHIKDCIVFPVKGRRPHPDEMAGSDLDGDEYVVIWLDKLIFERNNYPPMKYPTYEETEFPGKIGVNEMVDFFCQYIQNDNIGVFANAHLAWADQDPEGIFSRVCLSISKKYPYVLDSAKTGTIEQLAKHERPHQYPDFMEKKSSSNSYYSTRTLGLLYRITRNLKACIDHINTVPFTSGIDSSFCYPGSEKYEEWAEHCLLEYRTEIQKILSRFGARSVAEALCGGIPGQLHSQGRNEKANVESLVKAYIVHIMQKYKSLFSSEIEKESKEKGYNKMDETICRYRRASAWYVAAYKVGDPTALSFPWILSDVLAEVKMEVLKLEQKSVPDAGSFVMGNLPDECLGSFESIVSTGCRCVAVARNIMKNWLIKINLINSSSREGCARCSDRICEYYFSRANMSCCSSNLNECSCSAVCSAFKLIISMLKFYMNNVEHDLGTCADGCSGFWPTNLQYLALQTLVNLAVTRDTKYLGIATNDTVYEYDSCFADLEGDIVRIPVRTDDDKSFLASNLTEVKSYLKTYSGVKEITIETEKDSKENWFLLINCVGRNFQRWFVEDTVMDPLFIQKMKKCLGKEQSQ